MRDLMVGTVAAAMVLAPALAYSHAEAGGSFTAVDYAWRANGTSATTLTIAPGETVTFGYPSGADYHNVTWSGATPSCEGLPPGPRPHGWTGSCTFPSAGTFAFVCGAHPEMTGRVNVVAPPVVTPTPTPTPTAGPTGDPTPTATPGPGSTATPEPGTGPPATGTQQPATLEVMLAAAQRGTRVRGTVTVHQAKSRLEVTVAARLAKGRARVRIGRWVKTSAPSGAVKFAVALDAKARRALRLQRRLAVTVAVELTAPDGRKLTHSMSARVRAG